jgi:hypothetical protein
MAKTEPTRTRPEVSFRQLCAIAKDLGTQDTTIDAVEWKDRIKDRTHALGFRTPYSDQVWRAIDAVEHAHPTLSRMHRPRHPSAPPPVMEHSPTWVAPRLKAARSEEGFTSLQTILERVRQQIPPWTSAPSSRISK